MLYEKNFVAQVDSEATQVSVANTEATPNETLIAQAEKTDLEMPASVWTLMLTSYAVFFGGLIAATGRDGSAIFVIVVSVLYTFMYFGVASVLFNQNRPEQLSTFARGLAPLHTFTGPMDKTAVFGQILTIPFCLAFFGIVMAIFRAMIFG